MDPYTLNLLGALATGLNDRLLQRVEAESGLHESAIAALLTIGTRPEQTIEHIAETLKLSHSATVRLIERLIADELVKKQVGKTKRHRALSLTHPGRHLFEHIMNVRRQILAQTLDVLASEEQDVLERLIKKLITTLPNDQEDAWFICRYCEHAACRGETCPVGKAVG